MSPSLLFLSVVSNKVLGSSVPLKITDYEGIIQSKWGFWYKINDQFTTEQGYEIYSALNDNRNELSLFCGSFYTTNSQYEITLEYTKTTD